LPHPVFTSTSIIKSFKRGYCTGLEEEELEEE